MESLETLSFDWFWNDEFWLPKNVSWGDLKDSGTKQYPHLNDFYYVLPFALVLIVCRFFFERIIARPIGIALGVPTKHTSIATSNAFLENVFTKETRRPDEKRMQGLAKQLDWSSRGVERWFRKRRFQQHKVKIDKFTESCWRWAYYTFLFTYGVTNIPKETWFWNLSLCWQNFPFHSLTSSISNLYFLELSFYISLMLSAFSDVKRKDFWPMFCHHIFTSLLILFSWVCNFVRVGCLIIVIHDISDVFLESAKFLNYAKWARSAHCMFAGFALSFFFCRIVFFPFWVIHCSMVLSWQIVGPFPSWWFFNGLLLTLMGLNLYWFYYICKMVLKLNNSDEKTEKDARSEDDESNSEVESEEERATKKIGANGTEHRKVPNGS